MIRTFTLSMALAMGLALPVLAQSEDAPVLPEPSENTAPALEPPMTMALMGAIVSALDPDALVSPRGMRFSIGNVPVTIIADAGANRMRILVPIASTAGLSDADLLRLMQANFDTALDARYAVAQDRLWSVYIHPLAELKRAQFVSGLAQTVTLARNYGSSYSSGGVVFGGGDSGALFRDLLDKSEDI